MRRAISALNCQIDEIIAPLFYKCRMFCVHDSETNRANYYENPYYKMEPGYEVELVEWLKKKGVEEAYSVKFREAMSNELQKAQIKVISLPDQERSVLEVIETFDENNPNEDPTIGENPCKDKYGQDLNNK